MNAPEISGNDNWKFQIWQYQGNGDLRNSLFCVLLVGKKKLNGMGLGETRVSGIADSK